MRNFILCAVAVSVALISVYFTLQFVLMTPHFSNTPQTQPVPAERVNDISSQSDEISTQMINAARQFYDGGQYQQAVDRYNGALSLQPDNPSARLYRGLCYVELGDAMAAIHDLNHAIKASPGNHAAYGGLAKAYLSQGRYDEALNAANLAIRIKPKARYYDTRAEIYTKLTKYDNAIDDYSAAIKLDNQDAFAYTNRADLYTSQKDFDLAKADYDKLLAIDKTDAETYVNRGWMYAEAGQYDKAVQDADTALRIDPKNDDALNTRGYAQLRQAKGDSASDKALLANAVADFTKAIAISPDSGEYYYHRSLAESKLGQAEKSQADAGKAIELGYE
jgi:tetratricopeptide (TPR) repeat protein